MNLHHLFYKIVVGNSSKLCNIGYGNYPTNNNHGDYNENKIPV